MARFRNRSSGVVVSRRDDAPALPAAEWEPAEAPDTKKPTRRRAAKKSDTDDE